MSEPVVPEPVFDPAAAKAKLLELDEEAARLLTQREGVHNMHGFRAAVRCYASRPVEKVETVDWVNLDLLIRAMRICVSTGGSCTARNLERRHGISYRDL